MTARLIAVLPLPCKAEPANTKLASTVQRWGFLSSYA